VAVDADLDAARLRGRHPDRSSVVILPAVVAVTLNAYPYPPLKPGAKPAWRIWGRIDEIPSVIHVPRPYSEAFRKRGRNQGGALDQDVSYRVQLRYGSSLEPWVTGVAFTDKQ
jgi:hypothetical protein